MPTILPSMRVRERRSRPFAITLVTFWLASLAAAAGFCGARAASPSEYELKAVFLFNFAQFVEWPSDAFPGAAAPLVIGVLGKDPFGEYLDAAVRGESVMGRALVVKRYRSTDEVEPSHMLFVSRSELAHFDSVLSKLDRRALLIVSDIDRSAERGAVIQFISAGNRIRLRINVDAARAAGLTISSKLLRPAEIVAPRAGA